MGLLDLVTGGQSGQAEDSMKQALAAIQAVKVPTADEMKFQIQSLVQAGVLTPEQARTFLQSPNAMEGMPIDPTGTDAQQSAIAGLLSAAQAGGLNPQEQSQIDQIKQQLGTQERGANDAIVQRQAERGALTGGETMAAQLQANQNATVNANQMASNTAGQAYQQMLNELTSAGSLGSGLQGQQNQQANTVGAATNAINQFNAAQQQNTENYNVGNQNYGQQFNLTNAQDISNQNVGNTNRQSEYNAQLPQQIFGDQMQKAGAEAGANMNMANLHSQQGGQTAGLIGGLVGTAGEVGGAMAGGPAGAAAGKAATSGVTSGMGAPQAYGNAGSTSGPGGNLGLDQNNLPWQGYDGGGEIQNYLNGGQVNGHAQVPGNSPQNDTVPAMLSPGEVVLPRTVAQQPTEDKVMGFLQRMRQKRDVPPAHPHDVRSVLDALSLRRGQ